MQIRTRQTMGSPRCHFLKVASSLSENKHLFVEFTFIYLIRVGRMGYIMLGNATTYLIRVGGVGYIMLGNATTYLCWAIIDYTLVCSHETIRTCLAFELPHWISVVESLVFFGT